MFTIDVENVDTATYVTDKDAFVYQLGSLFGDGEEDNSDCNSIGCMLEHYSFTTKGKKTSATTWSVEVAMAKSDNAKLDPKLSFICPLETMVPSVSGSCLAATTAPGSLSPTTTTVSINDIDGPTASQMSGSCTDGYLLELICTGNPADINRIARYKEDDSPGFYSRPYNDAAIMMINAQTSTFWTPDSMVTTFELIGMDEDGDGNACNIMGCSDGYDVVAYLRGPNPYYGEVAAHFDVFVDGTDPRYFFLCPRGDMIITLTPFCSGVVTTWSSDPRYVGAYAQTGAIDCTGVEVVSVECAFPQP